MTVRKPLVLVNGSVEELSTSDTLVGGYSLPGASDSTLGGIIVGEGLFINANVLSVTSPEFRFILAENDGHVHYINVPPSIIINAQTTWTPASSNPIIISINSTITDAHSHSCYLELDMLTGLLTVSYVGNEYGPDWHGHPVVVPVTHSGGQPLLVSGTNIKTINGTSILGSGDLVVVSADTNIITASENLAVGDLVNIWDNSGANVRKATASVEGKEAHGFVLEAVTSGDLATVYFEGTNNGVTGLTPGLLFLSITDGLSTSSPVFGTGNVIQRIGFAVSSTAMNFQSQPPIILV